MNIDIDDMVSKINNDTKAILATHYLGFPQPLEEIKTLCREKCILLIEDCAHAFLSRSGNRPVGSIGDFSVFSLRKTLPVPDGGMLIINNNDVEFNLLQSDAPVYPTLYMSAFMLKHGSFDSCNAKALLLKLLAGIVYSGLKAPRPFMKLLRKLTGKGKLSLLRPDLYEFEEAALNIRMTQFSKKISDNCDFQYIKNTRRAHYHHIHKKIKQISGVRPFFENLPEGVNPLLFPVIINNRQRVYQEMKKKSILTHPYWYRFHKEVPWNIFPDAVFLKHHILGLPVHQDLSQKNLDYMLEILEKTSDEVQGS